MATKAPQAGPASPATVAKALLKTLSPPIAIATTIWCLWLYSHIGSKVGLRRGNGLMPRNLLCGHKSTLLYLCPTIPPSLRGLPPALASPPINRPSSANLNTHHSAACPPLPLLQPLPTLTHTPQHTALYPTHAHHSGSFCTHCSCCSPSPCAHH